MWQLELVYGKPRKNLTRVYVPFPTVGSVLSFFPSILFETFNQCALDTLAFVLSLFCRDAWEELGAIRKASFVFFLPGVNLTPPVRSTFFALSRSSRAPFCALSQAQYRQLKSFPTGNGLKVRRSHIHGWGLFACDEFQKGAGAYIAGVRIIHTYTQRCFFVGVSFCTVKIKNGKTGLAAISLPSLCCSCCDIIYFFCAGKVQNKQIRRYIAVRSVFFFLFFSKLCRCKSCVCHLYQ